MWLLLLLITPHGHLLWTMQVQAFCVGQIDAQHNGVVKVFNLHVVVFFKKCLLKLCTCAFESIQPH